MENWAEIKTSIQNVERSINENIIHTIENALVSTGSSVSLLLFNHRIGTLEWPIGSLSITVGMKQVGDDILS
jgi:hypothetical protein